VILLSCSLWSAIRHSAMSIQPINVHDAFFKQVLSDPALAGTFLREHLPPDVAALLGPELPEPVPASFVDEELRQHHSDLLFRVRLKAGTEAFAYMLLEHKSSPESGAPLQLLRYVVRILSQWHKQHDHTLPLPPVLPLLANQGPERWNYSCEFIDLFGAVPSAMSAYLPSFRHALVDLSLVGDRALSTEVRLRAFLKALKYSRQRDLPLRIDVLLAEAPSLTERDLITILTYLDKSSPLLDDEIIREALQRLVPHKTEKIMGCITQPFYDRGKKEGIAEGKAEGKIEGEARILSRLLERRFGVVPEPLRQRIFSADVHAIESWAERAFDAPDLQSIFDSN
jgi:predicted transposase/invertase (TIGR01784 family)